MNVVELKANSRDEFEEILRRHFAGEFRIQKQCPGDKKDSWLFTVDDLKPPLKEPKQLELL